MARVNLSCTVQAGIKEDVELVAKAENNSASRLVENVLLTFLTGHPLTRDKYSNKEATAPTSA